MDSVGRPTYQEMFGNLIAEINEESLNIKLQPAVVKAWQLDAMARITERITIIERYELLLVTGQEDYYFNDSTLPVTGTGNVTTSGLNLTGTVLAGTGTLSGSTATIMGVGTAFRAQLKKGSVITVGAESREVLEIHSDTEILLATAFSVTITNAAFTYSTTTFSRELVVGSVITIDAVTATIASVIDGKTATLVDPLAVDIVGQTFKIDTKVTEIPTRFSAILDYDRLQGGFRRTPKVVSMNELLARRQKDYALPYTSFSIPLMIAEGRDGSGRRFLKMYRPPDANKSITIYGRIKIKPRFYASAVLTDSIPLNEEFEYMIRNYCKGVAYASFGQNGEKKLAGDYYAMFEKSIMDFNRNIPSTVKMEMTYK